MLAGEEITVNAMYKAKPSGTKPLGRPRQSFMENVLADLERLGLKDCLEQKAMDHQKSDGIINEAKSLQELYVNLMNIPKYPIRKPNIVCIYPLTRLIVMIQTKIM